MGGVLEAMLARVPDIYDKSVGNIFYDTLAPVAPEIEALGEQAAGILDSRFIDTAEGDELTRAASEFGVDRKSAQYAKGEIKFTGTAGTTISAGALVASQAAQFYTQSDCTIASDGTVTVKIVCASPGIIGNVGAGAINRLPVTLSGVTSCGNASPTYGGEDRESDEELRERVYLKVRAPGTSGNKNDYVTWALTVDGVGGAKCVPLWNGAGTVKVVIVNSSGEAASSELVTSVSDYIETVRPVGASVTVVSATAKTINVKAALVLKAGYTADTVAASVTEAIRGYLRTFKLSGTTVSYARIGAIILSVEGVDDYSGLQIGVGTSYGADNISIGSTEVPVMGAFTNGS